MMFNLDFRPLFIAAFLGATLGLWKLVEIMVWVFSHISWN